MGEWVDRYVCFGGSVIWSECDEEERNETERETKRKKARTKVEELKNE